MSHRNIFLIMLVIAAVALRLLPHPPNFSPVLALALFSGVFMSDRKLALLIPFGALLISDLVLGLHQTMIFVYGAFALVVLVGTLLKKRVNAMWLAGASVSGSVVFFVVTNFGAWLTSPMYEKSIAGLTQAYVAGIPFFQNALIGDLLYSFALFGAVWILFDRRQAVSHAS